MDVLAVDALSVGVVVGRIACPYPGLAPRCPVAARALAQAAIETEVADVELLLLGLGGNVEEELAPMLNSYTRFGLHRLRLSRLRSGTHHSVQWP